MLIGAMTAFSVTIATGNPWIGVLAAMFFAGVISQVHAFIVITLQADQVVSGLALTFLGTGISLVLGEGLSKAGTISLMPNFSIPLLSQIPVLGPIFFRNQSVLVYIGYLLTPLAWYYINRTRGGLHLRAVGEYPAAADALGINVFRMRYLYVFVGGLLAGLSGATIVFEDPFYYNPYLGVFLQMLPYAFTVIVLVIGSREAIRERLGAPAALGNPYIRGERGL